MKIKKGAKVSGKNEIVLVGIGGNGIRLLNAIEHPIIEKKVFISADKYYLEEQKILQNSEYLLIGQNTTHGLGTGMKPEIAKEAVLESKKMIYKSFKDAKEIVLLASLGAGTGTGGMVEIYKIAKQTPADIKIIVTTPFNFEGKKRTIFAEKSLKELSDLKLPMLILSNEEALKKIPQDYKEKPLSYTFKEANKIFIHDILNGLDKGIYPVKDSEKSSMHLEKKVLSQKGSKSKNYILAWFQKYFSRSKESCNDRN
ncbi:hypothetical protein [Sulfurimonas sp.]